MITTYKYLKHGQPIPKGWRLASKLEDTHHGKHAILIKRDITQKRKVHMANHPRRSIIKDWPEYLKAFRKKYHLTQKQLADKLQVSCRVVENWEAGQNKPAAYLKKALKELSCELSE